MKLLAIDTATRACSAAVWVDGQVVAQRFEEMARGQSEALMPMVTEVMAEAGVAFDALDLLAATVGPGAFTGLRIGLAAARGMALALSIPCVGVTTLEAVADGVPPAEREGRNVLAALDAKRADLYVQLFSSDLEPLSEPEALMPADLTRLVSGAAVVVGDAAGIALEALNESGGDARAEFCTRHSRCHPGGGHRGAAVDSRYGPGGPGASLPAAARRHDLGQQWAAEALNPMDGPTLEPCGVIHVEVLAALHAQVFPDAWDAEAFRTLLATPGILGFVACDGAVPQGFVLGRMAADECEILTIGVLPQARRRGTGRLLLDSLVAAAGRAGACQVFLEVGSGNGPARKLYESHGFVAAGRRPNYYTPRGGPPEDALILRLGLAESEDE